MLSPFGNAMLTSIFGSKSVSLSFLDVYMGNARLTKTVNVK